MALIASSWTTATSESYTRADVLRRLLREGFGEYGTATGGSTSTIVDTGMLKSSGYRDDRYKGMFARIEYDAGGAAAAPEGDIRPITASVGSTGTLTASPDFSAAVASGDKYQLWTFIHPQKVLDTLDQVLTQDCWLPDWTILTEVPDGDMEQSGTTDWAATNATVTKVSSEPALWGKRWLSVATTSAGGYAQSNTIRVVPGQRYHVSAICRASAASTTCELTVRDLSNGANISQKTSTYQTPVRLWVEFTAPSGCHQMAIRLGNSENSVTSFWDEACAFSMDSNDLPLPWWVRNKSQVKGIFKPRWTELSGNVWDPVPHGDLDLNNWDFRDSAFGRNQLRIVSRHGAPTRPMYIFGLRPETSYSNENSDTKHFDLDWMTARMMTVLLRQVQGPLGTSEQHRDWLAERMRYWDEEWKKERKKQDERINDVLQAVAPEQYVYPSETYWVEARLVN